MDKVLKYDPLKTFQEHREMSDALDNLISHRVETNLEEKLHSLLKQLITTEDDNSLTCINTEIQNLRDDLNDLRTARELRTKKSRERGFYVQ